MLKKHFPNIPVMALTATASSKVEQDVIKVLSLSRVALFKQSFNRTNLTYSVVKKTKQCLTEQMPGFIQDHYHNKTGIVYCLSKKDCEQVAEELRNAGIIATHYHAGLDTQERHRIQVFLFLLVWFFVCLVPSLIFLPFSFFKHGWLLLSGGAMIILKNA